MERILLASSVSLLTSYVLVKNYCPFFGILLLILYFSKSSKKPIVASYMLIIGQGYYTEVIFRQFADCASTTTKSVLPYAVMH